MTIYRRVRCATLRTYVSRVCEQSSATPSSVEGRATRSRRQPEQIDAGRFESLLRDAEAADSADPDEAVTLLDAALRSGAAPRSPSTPTCRASRRKRAAWTCCASASEARARALLHAGRYDESVAAAEALVTAEPLFEGAWTRLIEGLAAQGRTADALRAFQRAAAALADAGLEPSRRLARGRADGARGRAARGRQSPTGAAASSPRPPRVAPPTLTSSFVGRDDECAHSSELLEATRIVTLVGTGGVGKTRLAIETALVVAGSPFARRAARRARRDPRHRRRRRCRRCRARPHGRGRSLDRELDRAGALDVLLVLDNAEHVLDAAADVVARAVSGGDALRVLATSRERLGVDGEHVRPVAPLATERMARPAATAPRATGRGRRTRPRRWGSTTSWSAGVVTRLDGLPLAIEMAAAQLSTMSLAELDAELRPVRPVVRRCGRRTATRRRATRHSRAVLEWSESAPRRRRARHSRRARGLRRIVHRRGRRGGARLARVANTLRSLVDRSLVRIDRTGPARGTALLQTVREFAAERMSSARQRT